MRWTIEDTAERAAFREEVRGWLRENLPPGWMDAVDAGDEEGLRRARACWDPGPWSVAVGTSGYGAPLWPKEYGGLSGEPWTQQLVREELGRYRLPTVGINFIGVALAGPTIITHGTDQQKERYLRKILTCEEIWCQLFSEPGSGSDLASVSTRAMRSDGEWIVNGQKVWTSFAEMASFGILLARTDPEAAKHEGLSYFIVDMKAPGVDVCPLRHITGAADFNEVYFDDVRIPAENLVGIEGDGWRVARTTLMNERGALAGVSIDANTISGGGARNWLQSFADGLADRTDPRSRQLLARLYIDKEVKEITSFRAQSARLRGDQPGPEGAVAKVFNAEYNQWRTSLAMNGTGPGAVAWLQTDAVARERAQVFLRARANSIEGGTSEVLRNQMGERILGLPREPSVDRDIAWKEIKRS